GTTATGSLRANVGDNERWNLGLSGSYQNGGLTLSGDLGARHDLGQQYGERVRERLDPVTGAVLSTTRQSLQLEGPSDVFFGRFTADYRISSTLSVTGELRGNLIDNT